MCSSLVVDGMDVLCWEFSWDDVSMSSLLYLFTFPPCFFSFCVCVLLLVTFLLAMKSMHSSPGPKTNTKNWDFFHLPSYYHLTILAEIYP